MELETKPVCDFPECGRPAKAKRLCAGHYCQQYKGQDLAPLKPRSGTIPVEERFWSKVNKTAGCWLWTAVTNQYGYGHFLLNRKPVYAHRYSFAEANGPIPEGMLIDHICGVPSCVRPEHLRLADFGQNAQHRVNLNKNNKSGYRGVHRMPNGKWRAMVAVNQKHMHVGVYATPEEAAIAAEQRRMDLGVHIPKETPICA